MNNDTVPTGTAIIAKGAFCRVCKIDLPGKQKRIQGNLCFEHRRSERNAYAVKYAKTYKRKLHARFKIK